jgi:hypothetical protein
MTRFSSMRRLAFCAACLTVMAACNLGTPAPEPPTLEPRPSLTPEPTMGIAGSGGVPVVMAPAGSTPAPMIEAQQAIVDLVNQVEIDRLMAHVDALQNFYTRHVNSETRSPTRGIGAARKYIEDQFELIKQQGGNLDYFPHEFDLTWGKIQTHQANIVAVVPGTEPGAGFLVVGAHYDSIVIPDFTISSAFAPGANDNGTGVAAILEMARIAALHPHRSSIMFVAFSAEEVGRKGSIAFANWLVSKNVDVFAMINIDTIGNQDDGHGGINASELRVFSNKPNDTIDRQLARTAEFLGFTQGSGLDLGMKLAVQDAIDREDRYGDHFSFTEKGIPSIRFINAVEEKINGDPTDTIEYIEPSYFRRAVQSILLVVAALADGPLPPRNLTLRNNNTQLVWEPVPDAVGYIVTLRFPGSLSYNQQFEVPGNTTSVPYTFGTSSYEGIAIAARGPDGIVGRLSAELKIIPGS